MIRSFASWVLTALLCVTGIGADVRAAERTRAHSSSPSSQSDPSTPAAIGDEDIALYRRIFALQDNGDFAAAERLTGQLRDRVLLAYVLRRHYLAAGARPTWEELASWLDVYADHPGADDIYARAVSLDPARGDLLKRPEPRGFRKVFAGADRARLSQRVVPERARTIISQIKEHISDGAPDRAFAVLLGAQGSLDRNGFDDQAQLIAASYFAEGADVKAFALAHEVALRNRREVPAADWVAGLAAWRLGEIANAESHFAALAASATAFPATRAAGAFWAARANLRLQQPQRVGAFLEQAAAEPRTFYGVLALRQLGRELPFAWTLPPIDKAAWTAFEPFPAVARAVALAQIGRPDLAETELLRVREKLPPSLDLALLSVATRLHLSNVEKKISEDSTFEGLDGARYPVPNVTPRGGFMIDPALLYAFMHQESRFDAAAQNASGARGLMQIMPSTAKEVVGNEASANELKEKLLDPDYNLHVAQRYLRGLMKRVEPEGNLYMLAVAYNSGPGNLARWRDKLGETDPLLFIESVPSAETRSFIECVLTNYWAYRSRLGKDLASLDSAAAGEWPLYDASGNAMVIGAR